MSETHHRPVGRRAPADGQGGRPHRAQVHRDHQSPAQSVPELSGAGGARAGLAAAGLPECRDRHAAAFAEHDGERPGWRGQHHAHRRHAERQRRAAAPQRLHCPRPRRSSRSTSRRAAWMPKRAWRPASRSPSSPSRARTRFKGSAFEFFNNEKLNATPFFFGRTATPKLPIERQTFGGTLGGPIRRNQLFFFGSYEGYIGRQELFAFFNVPSAAIRNGDFSNALNANGTLQRIYDPFIWRPGHRHRPRAVREQHHPRQPHQRDLETASGPLSAAERRGHRGRRLHGQLPDARATPSPIDTTTTRRSTGTGRRRISSGANTAT